MKHRITAAALGLAHQAANAAADQGWQQQGETTGGVPVLAIALALGGAAIGAWQCGKAEGAGFGAVAMGAWIGAISGGLAGALLALLLRAI